MSKKNNKATYRRAQEEAKRLEREAAEKKAAKAAKRAERAAEEAAERDGAMLTDDDERANAAAAAAAAAKTKTKTKTKGAAAKGGGGGGGALLGVARGGVGGVVKRERRAGASVRGSRKMVKGVPVGRVGAKIKLKLGCSVRGIKIVDAESRNKVIAELKAEAAMKMME